MVRQVFEFYMVRQVLSPKSYIHDSALYFKDPRGAIEIPEKLNKAFFFLYCARFHILGSLSDSFSLCFKVLKYGVYCIVVDAFCEG
jgi:hypothetical protein